MCAIQEKHNAALLICRNIKDLLLVGKVHGRDSNNIIVASDNIEVHNRAKKDIRVNDVIFISQMGSVFSVIDDVLIIREQINKWLTDQSRKTPAYLLEWIKHVEGGMTTQRIQDALLFINAYLNLFNNHNIEKLYLNRNMETDWEDEVLISSAKSYHIIVKEYKSVSYLLVKFLSLVPINRNILGKERVIYAPESILFFYLRIRLWWDVIRAHFNEKRHQGNNKDTKEIALLLGSSADKHVDSITTVMEEFNKREGYSTVALCWMADLGRIKIGKKRLHVESLEGWFPLKHFLRLLIEYNQIKRSIKKNIDNFRDSNFIRYKKIALGDLLSISVKHFIENDLFCRLLLHYASENYFAHNHPAAMKVWGGIRFDLGRICYEMLKKSLGRGYDNPVVFDYAVGIDTGTYFGEPPVDALDLFFVNGELDKKTFEKMSIKTEIIIAGYPRESFISAYKNILQQESLKALGILRCSKYSIFYASTNVINGYCSIVENAMLADAMIQLAKNSNITLIIKPHPSESPNLLYRIYQEYGKPTNVIIVDRTSSVYHCINASDLVVQNFSTVAFEAMKLEKPVISVALGGQKDFQDVFRNSVEKFQDIAPFISFMERIISHQETFMAWAKKRIKAQNEFLPKKFYSPDESVEKLIVDNVIQRIEYER